MHGFLVYGYFTQSGALKGFIVLDSNLEWVFGNVTNPPLHPKSENPKKSKLPKIYIFIIYMHVVMMRIWKLSMVTI